MKARTRLHRIDSPLARTAAHTMVVLLALFGGAHDMHAATRIDTTRRSDQFVIHDVRKYGRSLAAFADSENPRLVQLEPDPLLMSAERIKEALLHELRLPARGGAAIHCYLYAPVRNNENILLVSTLHSDGWQYSLQVSDDLDRTKLVSGIVQVVLLEFANHGTAQKSAEIPAWLVEGLTKQLLAKVGTELVVDSEPANALRRTVRELRGADSLAEARQYLRTHRALSFSELSQPLPAVASDETMRLYR